jgi:hypothetical protein
MSKQVFVKPVPQDLIYDLLDKVATKTDKYYIVDIDTYKRVKFYELQKDFISTITSYYHLSKKFYVERPMTYTTFVNIIRQVCRSNKVTFTSKIKYNDSTYNIEYYIYFLDSGSSTGAGTTCSDVSK